MATQNMCAEKTVTGLNILYFLLVLLYSIPAYTQELSVEKNLYRTEIKIFNPWGNYPPPAMPVSGIHVTKQLRGECWTRSLANPRPGAFRCSSEDAIYDPCFRGGFSKLGRGGEEIVACMSSPWTRKAVLITLTKPLPKEDNEQDFGKYIESHSPWAIEFFDGTRCVFALTGTIPSIAEIPTNAICMDKNLKLMDVVTVDIFDRKYPLWFGFLSKKFSLEQFPVKIAWY